MGNKTDNPSRTLELIWFQFHMGYYELPWGYPFETQNCIGVWSRKYTGNKFFLLWKVKIYCTQKCRYLYLYGIPSKKSYHSIIRIIIYADQKIQILIISSSPMLSCRYTWDRTGPRFTAVQHCSETLYMCHLSPIVYNKEINSYHDPPSNILLKILPPKQLWICGISLYSNVNSGQY